MIIEAAFTEKESESYTRNENSKTLCPLLIQSRHDRDTAITHVCFPPPKLEESPVSSKPDELPCFIGIRFMFCSPYEHS